MTTFNLINNLKVYFHDRFLYEMIIKESSI